MQLTRLTACGFLVALAACSDAPVAPTDLSAKPDLSKITILKPSEFAAHGINPSIFPGPPKPSRGAARNSNPPCFIEIDNPDSCPLPPLVAEVDYFAYIDTTRSNGVKYADLSVFAQAHGNMHSTVLDVRFYIRWPAYQCGGGLLQFDSSHQVAYGSPVELRDERLAVYNAADIVDWLIYAEVSYTANPGAVVDGVFQQSVTYPAADEKCF